MPLQRVPQPGAGPSLAKSLSKAVPLRPLAMPPRQGANPRLAEARSLRRDAVRQSMNQAQPNRMRPTVRPVAAPMRVMPQTPRPVPWAAAPGIATMAVAGFVSLNTAAAHTTISSEAQALQSSISDLQQRSSFSEIVSDITSIDTALQHAGELLESARIKNYAYQADLETTLYDAMGQWEGIRVQVSSTVQQQANALQGQIAGVNPMIQGLNRVIGNPAVGAAQLRSTQSYVNGLLQNISRIEGDLQSRYNPVESQAQKLNSRLNQIHWAMDQLVQAKFALNRGEELVMAVPARWDKEGKDDPEGVLYLSSQRLIFERKEKVATKKVLFITTASELVHEVLIDQPLPAVTSVKAENKGLFGHQDFLQVLFKDPSLGAVSLHINGQDSKDWFTLVERSRSGQIEGERVNAGTGLSVADLTKALTPADIMALQSETNALQDEIMLKGARQELAELENEVRTLERKMADVRAQGYAIEKDLEADIAILAAQWDRVKGNTESTIEYQSKLLGEQMSAIQGRLSQVVGMSANLAAARPLYMQVKSAAASAQAQADAAEATVFAQYDDYADEVEGLQAHLEWIKWMLDALSTASFRLLATESGVAAVEAVFVHPTWEPENGVIFLTDQRLLWEDRVGTYELKVNVPLQEILDVQKDGEDEVLVVHLSPQGPVPEARFQLALPVTQVWIQMLGRARSGGYVQDRAVEISPEELDRVRNAPQSCQKCGAVFTSPVLRGQVDIPCEYCGNVTRI